MANVFLYCGSATLITIVEMIVMNLLTYAATTIVLSVGVVVLDTPTIAVSLNGCSVMEKMTAEMVQMNLQKTAHHAKKREISNVKIEDAFQSKFQY